MSGRSRVWIVNESGTAALMSSLDKRRLFYFFEARPVRGAQQSEGKSRLKEVEGDVDGNV